MAQEEGQTPGGPRELRLALCMRGGVSLAVWIGGTCCEIDQLRTATPGTRFWGRLLEASGYDAVAVDILAGASAGGLNGVIYAAAQQYGFPMDELRELWVQLGDTAKLLRTKEDAEKGGWPSLFKGDDYFFLNARAALEEQAGKATPPHDPPPVALTLSATLVEPIRRPGRSPSDEPLTESRFASGFVFKHPRHAWQGTDFPPGAGQGVWSRLALAARSTSSFPAAFEAALVRAGRVAAFGDPDPDTGEGLQVDMGGVFADRGRTPNGEAREFVVSDGGILDNIPLGRALDEIADAAAGQPTDRYLIYVQPGAPAPPRVDADKAGPQDRRDAFSVLRGVLAARLPNEDIVGDLKQLDDYNTRIKRAASLRRSGFRDLDSCSDLEKAAELAWDGYRMLRAEEDQRLVSKLLEDPVGVLKEDPFPASVGSRVVEDDRWRSPLDASSPALSRDDLASALVREFLDLPPIRDPQTADGEGGTSRREGQSEGAKRLPTEFPKDPDAKSRVVAAGARPLLRIISLLIEWAQHLENTVPQAQEEASLAKAKLYRTAAFVRDAIDRPRRLGWVALAATRPLPGSDDGGVASGNPASDLTCEQQLALRGRLLTGLAEVPIGEAARVCDALTAGTETPKHCTTLRDAVTGRLRALDEQPGSAWSASAVVGPDDAVDLRVEILSRVLVPIAMQELRPVSNSQQAPLGHDSTPGAFLDRALNGEIGAATLEALEVVAYPEFAAGLPGRRPVAFRRLSAANPTPLASHFERLIRAAQHSGNWWDRDNTDPEKQEGIHVALKLAGNELSNFSAFLVDEWRLNDWRWGRLDAVPTLVDLLLASKHFRRGAGVWDGARLEELIAGPPQDRSPMQGFILDAVLDSATRESALQELGDAHGEMKALRTALVAARQWEIIAEELAVDDPEALVERLRVYDAGAQTVGSSAVRDDTVSRLTAIAKVADDVAGYSAKLQFRGKKPAGSAKPKPWTRALRKASAFAMPKVWGLVAPWLVKRYVGREQALTDSMDEQ